VVGINVGVCEMGCSINRPGLQLETITLSAKMRRAVIRCFIFISPLKASPANLNANEMQPKSAYLLGWLFPDEMIIKCPGRTFHQEGA
jgi:hypothetical protein